MNAAEVERQIDQMVRFIKQEAEEKANEINVSAEEEFNIEKLQLIEAEKAKIRKDFERREGQIEVKKKIGFSKQLNEARLKVLAAREAAVQSVVHDAHTSLQSVAKDKARYRQLLIDLLVQALYNLGESAALVRAREVDLPLVREVLDPARAKYETEFGRQAPQVSLDTKSFLAPPPSASNGADEVDSCSGGVVVTSTNGRIVCSNTLDDRLRIAYTQNQPEIRAILFGTEAPVRG